MHKIASLFVFGCLLVVLGQVNVANGETPGEHFKKAMKRLADNCAKEKLRPGETGCDLLKLKPADPLATEEGRFAHSLKIPNPVSENSGYKPGMTPEQYFDHLCETEAGEFIYKTVENVEGLFMMRPRKEASDYELEHLYSLEDPYGYITEGSAGDARELFVRRKGYAFLEERSGGSISSPDYRRYAAMYDGNRKTLTEEATTMIKSRYGYTWRGITRPHDRELGIAGGELIILDAQSNEVLAVRRGFIRSGDVRNNLTGIWWLGGHACPKGKKGRTDFYTFDLMREVLKLGTSNVEKEVNSNAAK